VSESGDSLEYNILLLYTTIHPHTADNDAIKTGPHSTAAKETARALMARIKNGWTNPTPGPDKERKSPVGGWIEHSVFDKAATGGAVP